MGKTGHDEKILNDNYLTHSKLLDDTYVLTVVLRGTDKVIGDKIAEHEIVDAEK